ncbi:hypothetical protein Vretimale_9843 [Volvox reticuliferus]|uniref:F-box domain-containing protein n=1 Tax=Volvox reticuliferus TaxID=1737510 RepID=A0A8J4FUN1_9CHLO|nr:hypothetical protein Vretifemale_13623 [Volvox reticuliferus]GIM05373.1 hypothetical protein Vretimale_9843 [Volvox reticuliferus]
MISDGDGLRGPATERKIRGTSCGNLDGLHEAPGSIKSEPSFAQDVPTIASLPCGVLSHIFDDLGPRDLASASCVCRAWRRLVALESAANQVWRTFYSARWQLSRACWPLRTAAHTTANSISVSRPISVPGSNSNDVGAGSGSIIGNSDSTCAGASSLSSSSSASSTTPSSSPVMRWQWAYGTKMLRLRSWSGRYCADQVMGHKMAVRAVRLLPACDLMATASLDRTVRLWDLRSGLPLGHSRPHGGTVRCLAMDTELLASGSSDSLVRVWRAQPGGGGGGSGSGCLTEATVPLFSISSKPYILRGHAGPVSCLALDESLVAPEMYCGGGSDSGEVYGGTLFSGSWDCTVRVWRQGAEGSEGDDNGCDFSDGSGGSSSVAGGSSSDETIRGGSGGNRLRRTVEGSESENGGWSCAGVLQYSDWVYCCAVRGDNLLVAAGSEVVVTDAATGRAIRRFADVHDGAAVACLEGCRSGRLLFTASGDGLLLAHDLRMKQGSRVLWHHNAAVTGLAFEDPWVASSSADGCIILQDSEQALAGGGGPQRAFSESCRALHCPAGQPALCLDLSDQWLAAGSENGVVRMWDFTGAAAAAERATAARAARRAAKANRAARQQQHQQMHNRMQHPPPLPQLQLQQQQQRSQGCRNQYHQVADAATAAPPRSLLQSLAEPEESAGAMSRHGKGTAASDAASQAQGRRKGRCRRGGGGTASSGSVVATTTNAAPPRRSGCGGGGSSNRWRHGGANGHSHNGVYFPNFLAPKPPPPMVPTFRYVGNDNGGRVASGGGGGGGSAGQSGMAAIPGSGHLRMQQRPQRQ